MVRVAFAFSSVGLVLGQDLFLGRVETVVHAAGPLHSCLENCQKNDDKNFKNCQADGSTSCSNSKCCTVVTDTCFKKNAYWSACAPSCKKGVPDATGEVWDCTPLTASKCHDLQTCVGKCYTGLEGSNATVAEELDLADEAELTAAATGDPSKCTGGSLNVCKKGCQQSFDIPFTEHICEVMCDKNCANAPAKKCPSKKGIKGCVSHCKGTSNGCDAYTYRSCIDTCIEDC